MTNFRRPAPLQYAQIRAGENDLFQNFSLQYDMTIAKDDGFTVYPGSTTLCFATLLSDRGSRHFSLNS
jgi:hypothetical protein